MTYFYHTFAGSNSSSFLTLDSDSEEEGGGREATTDEGVGGTSPLSKGDASPEEKVPPPDPEVLMQALQVFFCHVSNYLLTIGELLSVLIVFLIVNW